MSPRPPGRTWEGAKAERAKGAGGSGRGRGSREQLEGEEILVGEALRPRLLSALSSRSSSGAVISDLGAQGWVLGPGWGSLGSPRPAIFSRRGGREETIYRSNSPRSLRQWNPACVTRRHSSSPLAPPPRAAQPAPPPAGTAPPPSPLYGQGSRAVRQRRPRPSPCVTERLRGGSVRPGSPSDRGCES